MSYDAFQNITIRQLESLVVLLEASSFTKAAARLLISQSALTKQIKNMEASAGTTLVNRGSTGVALTAEGQILYDYAKRIILTGLGVSILSLFAVRRELSQGLLTTVNIIDCPMERYFYIIYRRNFLFRKHHQHFLEVVRSYQPL